MIDGVSQRSHGKRILLLVRQVNTVASVRRWISEQNSSTEEHIKKTKLTEAFSCQTAQQLLFQERQRELQLFSRGSYRGETWSEGEQKKGWKGQAKIGNGRGERSCFWFSCLNQKLYSLIKIRRQSKSSFDWVIKILSWSTLHK